MIPAQLDVAEDVLSCTAYKATRVADIVCKRRVRLLKDRLLTLHHDSATNSEKVWYLSSSCRLEPEYVDELVPEQRLVRPPGSWSVTTKAFSSGQPIQLYCVTIHWPTSWLATRGYTSFTLGFETRQEAAQWHAHVQKHVSSMRLRSSSIVSKGEHSASACHSSKPSYDDRNMQWSSGGTTITRRPSQDKGFVAAVLEHWLGSREDKAPSLDGDGSGSAQQYRMPTSPVQIPIPSRPGSAPPTMADGDAADHADDRAYGQQMRGEDATDASSGASCCSQDYAPEANLREERWVPYRHTNGVAIYHQRQSKCSGLWGDEEGGDTAAGLGVGSEYMASSIVRGSPDECLAVLMDMASNTTILGPASAIELLEDADERQVLRIVVEATGMARRLCAPREVIVERVFKREECGVDVILFSSYEPAATTPYGKRRAAGCASNASIASTAGACSGSGSSSKGSNLPAAGLLSGWKAAAAVAAGAAVSAALAAGGSTAAAPCCVLLLVLLVCMLFWRSAAAVRNGGSRSWREWLASIAEGGAVMWYRPVWATVQGGYTISPREDANGGYSPECLVTCILKVELGGWLGERSWLRPFADALGWVDAYVERMLMAVILVKDEVEQRKFMVQPFSMLTGASRTAAAPGSHAGSIAEAAAGLQEVTLNGGIAQQQRQQAQWQRSSSRLRQQHASILDTASVSVRWQQQQPGSHRHLDGGGYSPYGTEQQQFGQQLRQGQNLRQGEQQLGRGSAGSFGDAGRKQQQQAKQKGRLGRMASRIYALRPRMLRGSSGDRAEQAASAQLPDSLYKESISFNSHITARTADASSSPVTSDTQGHAGLPVLGATGASAAAAAAALDLSDPKVLLASAGLPSDTQVVQPQYYMGGPQGPAARDATLNSKFWRELHTPGTPAPFKLRGATYLEDRQKVDGGMPQFVLGSVDLVETPGPTQHISRFLPQVRGNQAGYSFVVNLIIPGTPVLSLVAVFINEHHPDILDAPAAAAAGASASSGRLLQQLDVDGDSDVAGLSARSSVSGVSCSSSNGVARRSNNTSAANGAANGAASMQDDDATEGAASEEGRTSPASDNYQRPADTSDWQPFDYALHRFLHGDDAKRTAMFKLIPHIAEGSWVIKQSVGTVPVILGNKLKTVYYQTDRYIEACCDVTSSSAAAYITGMVRGATKSLVIDLGFVLEGQHSEELPEALLGAFRLNHLDCTTAKKIDTSRELPLLPRPLQHHQLVALQQQAQEQLAAAAATGGAAAAAEAAASLARMSDSAGVSANGGAGQQEQQQVLAQGGEQQMDSHHFQALAQRLQQRCRNSLSTVEGSRTMTGHARSRSAASVEELVSLGSTHSSSSPRITATSCSREQRSKASGSFSAFNPQPQHLQQSQQQRDSSSTSAAGLVSVVGHMPPSIRTSTSAGLAATPLPAPAPVDNSVSGGSAFGSTPAKQLFSNFLSFSTGGDKGSGGKGSAAASAADDAAAAVGNGSGLPHAYGAVSSLSVAATPVGTPPATGNNTPNAAAAAAGSLLGTVNSVSSVGARSGVGVATPTVAAAGVRGHHRTSSNSDCKTPAGAVGVGWPASPPTGSAEWSSKLSAAAYISRAHTAALAASAARRSGSSHHHQHSSSSSSNMADAAAAAAAAAAGATGSPAIAYLSVSPGAAGPEGEAAAGWLSKHPRTSSSGSAMILEHQQQLQQQHQMGGSGNGSGGVAADVLLLGQPGSSNGWGGASGSGGAKITASEQLRLAKQQQQQQAQSQGLGFRSIWGSGSQVPSSSGSLSVLAGCRQVSAGGGAGAGAAGAQVTGTGGSPPQQQKRRFSHRRFASLPVNGSA